MKNLKTHSKTTIKKVLFLTKYDTSGPSSRYRTYQYLPHLSLIQHTVAPLLTQQYLQQRFERGRLAQLGLLTKAFTQRIKNLWQAKQYDLVFIEYELIPYFPAWLERWLHWRNIPYIVDYDDALFHQYDQHPIRFIRWLLGKKIATVMRLSSHVIAGNVYLAEYAQCAGAQQVSIIPTVIDLNHYKQASHYQKADVFTIVWIGSPSTTPYLKEVLPALQSLSQQYPMRLRLIGADNIDLPGVIVERLLWQQDKEVEYLSQCHVGIMPLPDTHWTRGKCGFKLIQYMACGLPVIASPVGVNAKITSSDVGFLAVNTADWLESLEQLLKHSDNLPLMGQAGRTKVESSYCLQSTHKHFNHLLATT